MWVHFQLEIVLVIMALVLLTAQALRPIACARCVGWGLATIVFGLFLYSLRLQPPAGIAFNDIYVVDAFTLFFKRFFLLIASGVLLVAAENSRRLNGSAVEYFFVILIATVGALVVASVNDFILMFVALELFTISFYILAAFQRRDRNSLEAGIKYLIMGALASGVLVYGISYVFGVTGSTRFDHVAIFLIRNQPAEVALLFGMTMVLLGLSFKIAAVPGQLWAPDVYQGAPTPTTAFLATGSKTVGFALIIRLLCSCFSPVSSIYVPLLIFVAAATLIYGNFGAIPQRNIKRLFGYSSIAHAGYLLAGLSVQNIDGVAAVIFYLVQYALANLCFFLALAVLQRDEEVVGLYDLNGLHHRAPLLAAALAVPVLSLAGVPPLSGFFGKFLIIIAVLKKISEPYYLALIVLLLVGVLVSLYYYFGLVRVMYFERDDKRPAITIPLSTRFILLILIALVVGLGVYQKPLYDMAQRAIAVFFPG